MSGWHRTLARAAGGLLLAGCATGCHGVANVGPGSAAPGLLYTHLAYPNDWNAGQEYQLSMGDIEIGDPVDSTETSVQVAVWSGGPTQDNILGLDDSSYGAVLARMQKEHGYDGLLNKFVSTHVYTLNLLIVRVSRISTELGGVGWNYRERRSDAEP